MKIWRLMTHHLDQEKALVWTRQNKRIAIGWGQIGDVRQNYTSSKQISQAI